MFFRKKKPTDANVNKQVLAKSLLKTANTLQGIVIESGHDFKGEVFRDCISMYTEEERRLSGGNIIKAHQCALLTAFHLLDMMYENRGSLLPNKNDHENLLLSKTYILQLIPGVGKASGSPAVDERQLNNMADQVYSAIKDRCGSQDMADMIKTAVVANTIGASANTLANADSR